jgi:proteasome lid subunit RPN8/RPN11
VTNLGVAPPVHLTPDLLAEIGRIGLYRAPGEACGILLPYPRNSRPESQVVELPNRHKDFNQAYMVQGEDIAIEIGDWLAEASSEDTARLSVWHTHPGGGVGPSRGDLRSKVPNVAYLVVSLNSDGSFTPCWF